MLIAHGVGGLPIGARSMVEAALPLAAGGALGYLVALGLAGPLDPVPGLQPQATAAARREVALAVAAGLLLFGLVTWIAVRSEERERARRLGQVLATPWWEVLALALAAAALYELWTRGGAPVQVEGEPAQVDRPDGTMAHVRGALPDHRKVPRRPHPLAPGLMELPLSATRKRLGARPVAHLSRMRRHGIRERLDQPLPFGQRVHGQMPFGELVRRSGREARARGHRALEHRDIVDAHDQRGLRDPARERTDAHSGELHAGLEIERVA